MPSLINAHLLEYLRMLCISLTVQPGCLVDLAQLLLGLIKLALEVLHQLLVTSILTLGQITFSFGYLLLTSNIPREKGKGRERRLILQACKQYHRKSLLDNLPQLLCRLVTRGGRVSEHCGHTLSSLVLKRQQPSRQLHTDTVQRII